MQLINRHSAECCITGWGHYVPERRLRNKEFEGRLATSSTWIESRTGILERRIAADHESTSSMCQAAAETALARAQLKAADIQLIICATTTPDYLLPNTAALIQRRIGATGAGAFDLNSACTGFLYAMIVASQFIRAGTYERILVVAGETLSRFLDWNDRSTCILFGDGAAAAVLQGSGSPLKISESRMECIGDTELSLAIKGGGSMQPASQKSIDANQHVVSMRGREVFKLAVGGMHKLARDLCQATGISPTEIGVLIPHQANMRIISAVGEALGLDSERVFSNVQSYGNVGAASTGIALSEYLSSERAQRGGKIVMVSFGGGFTAAGTVIG